MALREYSNELLDLIRHKSFSKDKISKIKLKLCKEHNIKNIPTDIQVMLNADEEKLNEWMNKNDIQFPVGMVRSDEDKIHFTWGVRSLPWLVLTDQEHIVRAEGFSIDELDKKIIMLTKNK